MASAVKIKICKQCLQTASASGGLCHPESLWGFTHESHWGMGPPDRPSGGYSHKYEE